MIAAVNVVAAALQTVVEAVEIEMVGVTDGKMVTVMALEVAGFEVTHGAFEVSTQVITSLLDGALRT